MVEGNKEVHTSTETTSTVTAGNQCARTNERDVLGCSNGVIRTQTGINAYNKNMEMVEGVCVEIGKIKEEPQRERNNGIMKERNQPVRTKLVDIGLKKTN